MAIKTFKGFGMEKTCFEWLLYARVKLGVTIGESAFRSRIADGMTVEQALTTTYVRRDEHALEEQRRRKEEAEKIARDRAMRLITKRMIDRSPHKDTVTFYGGDVLDFLPKAGHNYDVAILYRRSSSCVSWETVRGIDELRIAKLLKQKDVLKIEDINQKKEETK